MTELVALSATDARALTDRIKVGVEAIWDLITRAYSERAWDALGYTSWDDYCTREFGTSRLRLPREERQEVVASLRESGLSIRAIAAATGDSYGTVRNELASGDQNCSPEITGTDGKTYTPKPAPVDGPIAADEPEIAPGMTADQLAELNTPPRPAPQPDPVAPAAPRRKPITDQARDAGWELRKAVERIERIAADDRFAAQIEKMTPQLRGHLTDAITSCQAVLDRINNQ
jgi:hypothetical protein